MLRPLSAETLWGGAPAPAHPPKAQAPAEAAALLDIHGFAAQGHPYTAYAALRTRAPVAFVPEAAPEPGFWALTRYDDVREASLRTDDFSSGAAGIQISYGEPAMRHPLLFRATVDTMICLDAPDHIQLRKEHMPFFTPAYVAGLKAKVEAKTTELLDGIDAALHGRAPLREASAILPRGQIDLVEYLSAELPLFTLCEMLGVPEDGRRRLIDWMHYLELAQATLTRVRAGAAPTADDLAFFGVFMAKVDEMFDYGRELLYARRKEPRADLLSAIANMRPDGDLLDENFLDGSWLLIVFAGNDTTRNTISGTMKLLTEYPHERAKLIADPGLLPNMVEEAIRHVTPVIHMRRTARKDTEIGGQKIAAGEKLVLWYGAANRDPSVFPDPDRFDVTRANAKAHLAFGIGPHVCLGQRVAQMQLEACYRQLLARMPSLHYAGGMEIAPNNFVLAISKLPVAL